MITIEYIMTGDTMEQYRAYSNSEIEYLINEYGNTVYRLALMKTKQKEKADDIFQDVFIRLIGLRNRLDGEEHMRAWMIKTTLNCCRDLWKSAWNRHVVYEQMDVEVCDEEPEVKNVIRIIVMGLPDKYRIIVHLYYYEEFSIKEISKILKINQNTVCTRLARARRMLKKEFENGGFHYEI